jgi:hypothetical protein
MAQLFRALVNLVILAIIVLLLVERGHTHLGAKSLQTTQ